MTFPVSSASSIRSVGHDPQQPSTATRAPVFSRTDQSDIRNASSPVSDQSGGRIGGWFRRVVEHTSVTEARHAARAPLIQANAQLASEIQQNFQMRNLGKKEHSVRFAWNGGTASIAGTANHQRINTSNEEQVFIKNGELKVNSGFKGEAGREQLNAMLKAAKAALATSA